MHHIFHVLGCFCLVYFAGVLLFGGHGTKFYFIWLVLGIFCIALGRFINSAGFYKIPVLIRRGGAVLAVAGLVALLAAFIASLSGFRSDTSVQPDEVIVLGAQVKENGPSLVLQYRLDRTLEIHEMYPDARIIVSGGKGGNEPCTEAEAMKDYLVEHGVPEDLILMEDRSVNTVQNLTFSKALLASEEDSVGIVTSNFHVFRGTHIAEKLGYRNVYGIAAKSCLPMLPNNMLRESLSIIKDKLFGNI